MAPKKPTKTSPPRSPPKRKKEPSPAADAKRSRLDDKGAEVDAELSSLPSDGKDKRGSPKQDIRLTRSQAHKDKQPESLTTRQERSEKMAK